MAMIIYICKIVMLVYVHATIIVIIKFIGLILLANLFWLGATGICLTGGLRGWFIIPAIATLIIWQIYH
jgi:hypothetical protein